MDRAFLAMGHTGPHWGYYTGATLGQKKMCQPSACAAPAITSISWPIPNPQRPHPFPSYPRHFQFFPYSCSLLAASHTPQPPPHPPSLAFRPVRDEFFDAFHDAFPEVFVSTAVDIEPRPLPLLYQAALLPKPSAFPPNNRLSLSSCSGHCWIPSRFLSVSQAWIASVPLITAIMASKASSPDTAPWPQYTPSPVQSALLLHAV